MQHTAGSQAARAPLPPVPVLIAVRQYMRDCNRSSISLAAVSKIARAAVTHCDYPAQQVQEMRMSLRCHVSTRSCVTGPSAAMRLHHSTRRGPCEGTTASRRAHRPAALHHAPVNVGQAWSAWPCLQLHSSWAAHLPNTMLTAADSQSIPLHYTIRYCCSSAAACAGRRAEGAAAVAQGL